MRIAGIANKNSIGFLGKDIILRPGEQLSTDDIKKESAQAKRAGKFGVSAPKYTTGVDCGQNILTCSIKGDEADPKTNAISKKHLKNLFKNFYLMDKAGMLHNRYDKSGVFLDRDGGVEFGCFRYSQNFAKKPGGSTSDVSGVAVSDAMPSNEVNFEEQYLSGYVANIENDAQKHDFVKNYLKEKSYYHQKRADMLVARGFDPSSRAVEYEEAQSEGLKNPSDEIINYNIGKLEFLREKQDASAEWLDAVCSYDTDAEMRFDSVRKGFECLSLGAALRDRAQNRAINSSDEKSSKYFAYEAESADLLLDNVYRDIKEKGALTFNDTKNNIYLSTQKDKQEFEELCADIDIHENQETIEEQMQPAKELYEYLALGWHQRLNERYKAEYLGE